MMLDSAEGRADPELLAELDPLAKDFVLGLAVFGGGRVGALGRSQEPEEGDDDEVDDVGVEGSILRVIDIEGVDEPSQDGDVGWVGSACGVVVALEGLEERSE